VSVVYCVGVVAWGPEQPLVDQSSRVVKAADSTLRLRFVARPQIPVHMHGRPASAHGERCTAASSFNSEGEGDWRHGLWAGVAVLCSRRATAFWYPRFVLEPPPRHPVACGVEDHDVVGDSLRSRLTRMAPLGWRRSAGIQWGRLL